MTVEIIIKRDDGTVEIYHQANAFSPTDYKTNPEKPVVEGKYSLWNFVYQPTVTINLQNNR